MDADRHAAPEKGMTEGPRPGEDDRSGFSAPGERLSLGAREEGRHPLLERGDKALVEADTGSLGVVDDV